MSEGLTPKQEAFCLAYVETGNGAEAYRRAYDVKAETSHSSIYVAASRLMSDAKISLRVKEIQKQAVELVLYSKQQALEEYEDARARAMKDAQYSSAVSAVTGKAKLFGFHSDRVDHKHGGHDGGPIEVEHKIDAGEELESLLDRLAKSSS
jgi:phage terminase small subunit